MRELHVARPDGVTIHALIDDAKANAWSSTDRDVLTRRCRIAIGRGLLVNLETRRGQLARYRLSAAAYEDIGLIPSVLDLERSTFFDRSTSPGRATGRTQPIDEQGVSPAFGRSTSESEGGEDETLETLTDDLDEMTLDDLDRMVGEEPDWDEFDDWIR